MNNDPYYNPVGTEHPLRGRIVGAASLALVIILILGLCASCVCPRPSVDEIHSATVTNAVRIAVEIAARVHEARHGSESAENASIRIEPIVWRYGGIDASGSIVDPENEIADLRIQGGRLSYRFVKGNLSNWGVPPGSATAIACAFFWSPTENAWIGGKFEWVDSSRLSRDLGNLDGYGGWRRDLFFSAPERGFCIVSPDGRHRTNLITTKEP